MKAQQVRTIIIAQPTLALVQTALDLLRSGQDLSAPQSGTIAYVGISGLSTVDAQPWRAFFDGINYVLFVFVTSS